MFYIESQLEARGSRRFAGGVGWMHGLALDLRRRRVYRAVAPCAIEAWIVLRIAAICGAAALLGCSPSTEVGRATAAVAPSAEPRALVVETIEAVAGVAAGIVSHGSLVPRRESPIGPEVGGRLAAIQVEIGDRVEQGAPLFQIDPAPYQLALAQAEAGLDLARAELDQAAADSRRADLLLAKQVVAEQQVDRLATSLRVARARVRQAETQRDLAARNLALTEIRAPFPGSISERRVDEGTLVTPQTVVVVLQESAALEARVAISGTYLGRVRPGDRAELQVGSRPDPLAAVVQAVSDAVDPDTRTFLVRIPVANPERDLKAGSFLRAVLHPGARSGALVVPRSAIRTEDGEALVFAVRERRAVSIPVALGLIGAQAVEVLDGLAPGERVIADASVAGLVPGSVVAERPREEAAR